MVAMWTVKVVSLGVVGLSLSLEMLFWLFSRRQSERITNKVLFFPSEVACVEHIFSPTLPQ